ncbi:MAG: serine hydrolase domain-containing protein [Undibacterium sp.]|uniref:serine hydrolase domain-containing protein n=1 Tax=Undibacterium sp. TaxID=1914977 RepID=UPI002716F170|nr:serine hydrolase domain-containing protein [Undibacterium sp.]MDO8653195.1 serine hydrolase domain-containing protein [Undibacterium sp.]
MSTSNFWRHPRCANFLISLSFTVFFCPIVAFSKSEDVVFDVHEALTTDIRAQEIDAMLLKYFRLEEPGAVVIVSEYGAIIFRKAYGLASIETKLRLQPELTLRVGSITKQFTASAIMLLAEQGKLSVTDEIGKYFPKYPEHSRHVTIEHLLTHTSGIRNYTVMPQFGDLMTNDVTVDDGISFFWDVAPEFQPGQRFSYSNSNYFLLGAIIEKVSGEKYSDFMRQHIFLPLQMDDTVIEDADTPSSPVIGYTENRKNILSVAHYSMSWPFAAGALRTNVDDLVRWDLAIAAGALLKRESWDRMATDYTLNDHRRAGYGYGWFIRKIGGNTVLEHGGDIGGFSAHIWRSPQNGIFIAVLANNDAHKPEPDNIAEKIAKIILRH